jgi:penicillin-binding protein 2
MGDYIGITGVEKTYEKELKGKKGKYVFVDVHNRIMGSYQEGKFDAPAELWVNDITLSLDAISRNTGKN